MKNHFIAFSLALMSASSSPVPDSIRLSLEAESRKWFFWLLIAGAVVALGCILEIPETRFSLMQWWRQKRGRPPKQENPTSWHIPAASVGLLLVIVGVVGEVAFEGLASNADTRLRTHESEVLSDAETAAGNANERAGKLEAANNSLQGQVRDAREEADSFARDIVSAKQQAAAAESHLADALEKAANAEERVLAAEREIARLQQAAAPRRLTESQKSELVKLLSSALPFKISFSLSDPTDPREVTDFRDDLMDVFVRMQLIPPPIANPGYGTIIGRPRVTGVVVTVHSPSEYPPAATVFVNTLRGWGFDVKAEADLRSVASGDTMYVEVGRKQ